MAAQAGGPGGSRVVQFLHERTVNWSAGVARPLGGEDHQLLPAVGSRRGLLRGVRLRRNEEAAFVFADLDLLQGEQWVDEHCLKLGDERGDARSVADRDHHQRDVVVACKEPCTLSFPIDLAIDPE